MSSPLTSPVLSPPRRRAGFFRRASAVTVLAAVGLSVAACGSSSSSPSSTNSSSPGAGGSSATTSGGSSVTTSGGSSGSKAAGKAAISQLGSKIAAGQAATFVATYTLTSAQNGKVVNGTFKIAHDATNTLFSFIGPQGSFVEIISKAKSTVCAHVSGAWKCFGGALAAEVAKSASALLDFSPKAELAKLKALEGGAYDTSTSSQTFAGQSVTCITFHTHSNNGTFTVCVTAQGVPAEAVGTDTSGHYKLAMSNFSSSVPSNEFTPPAKTSTI